MIVLFKSAEAKKNYKLNITMTNGNRMTIDMLLYIDTVQFCPLKDKNVWKNIVIEDTCLCWKDSVKVELSIDQMLVLFKEGKKFGQEALISRASVGQNWILHLEMDNGNSLDMDMSQLIQFPLFTPLLKKNLWAAMKNKNRFLLWSKDNNQLKLSIHTILQYFA